MWLFYKNFCGICAKNCGEITHEFQWIFFLQKKTKNSTKISVKVLQEVPRKFKK